MEQISNERFGQFVSRIRKEKNLTQKELAEQLYVTDKTVSKWERGLSMPNVALLIPIAEVLGVTVTELLRGERIIKDELLNAGEVEEIVVGSLDLKIQDTLKQQKRNWIFAFMLCFILTIGEVILLLMSNMTFDELRSDVLVMIGLMLAFGGWFCFFAKDLLPGYYDQNKINYYTQGAVRMHMPGLSFNNSNWSFICQLLKAGTLSIAVLYPLICLIVIHVFDLILWQQIKMPLIWICLGGLVIATYLVGKKYE